MTPTAHESFRSAFILWGLLCANVGIILFLFWGHRTGKFDLYDLPKGGRSGKIEWRLLGEILMFPVVAAVVLIAAIRSHPDLWLIVGVAAGTYCARSVVGNLVAAKASVMTGGGWGGGGNRYGNVTMPGNRAAPAPVRGRVDAEPTP